MPVKASCLPVKLYFDGASKNNPGPSSAGWLLKSPQGDTLMKKSKFIGEYCTTDVAEYQAFLHGLKDALLAGHRYFMAHGDSMLVCNQIEGKFKVKPGHVVLPFYNMARELILEYGSLAMSHIPRDSNKEADALANEAIRRYRERIKSKQRKKKV